jgi:O-antigen/teichoic acid export membrane protein
VIVALPFLIASLSIRGIFTFDRYWVENISGFEVLGAYVIFIGIATAVISFLDSAVIVFLYPKIVAAAKAGRDAEFRKGMSDLFWNVLLVTLALVVCALFASYPLIELIGKDVYLENYYILKWLLLAITFYAVSMVPHIGLYAFGKDRAILFGQFIGLIIFLIGVFVGEGSFGVSAVLWAICVTFFWLCVWNLFAYHSMLRNQKMKCS